MKTRINICIAIGVLLLLTTCGDNNPTSTTDDDPVDPNIESKEIGPAGGNLTSKDGLLTLNIPAGALGESQTISIEKITADDLGSEFDNVNVQEAYELSPDGLVFESPIIIEYHGVSNDENDSLNVTFPGLLTEQNGTVEALGNLVYDGEKITAELMHFSPLVIEAGYATVTVQNLPAELAVGQSVALDVVVRINTAVFGESYASPPGGGSGRVIYQDNASDFFSTEEPSAELSPGFDADGEFFMKSVDYTCVNQGIDNYNSSIFAIQSIAGTDSVGTFIIDLPVLGQEAITVECIQPQEPDKFLQTGLIPLPTGYTKPETMFILGSPGEPFANFPQGSVPAVVQTAEGMLVRNLIDGSTLLERTAVQDGSAFERTALGALGVSRPNPGPGTLALIANYGQDNNSTEFGFNAHRYDPDAGEFPIVAHSPYPSTIDAWPIGGNVISDEVMIVREGGFGINFLRYNDISGDYVFRARTEAFFSNRYGGEQPVTGYGEEVEGAFLAVTETGDLYKDTRNKLVPSVFIGSLGQRIIRFRCMQGVCAATDADNDAIRIVLWDGINLPTIVDDPVQVGDFPVDPGLYQLPDGNTLIGTPGFNDNTISFVIVNPQGDVLSNTLYEAPDGLINPGHFTFVENPDDASNPYGVLTGFGSNNYYVNDRITFEKFTVTNIRP